MMRNGANIRPLNVPVREFRAPTPRYVDKTERKPMKIGERKEER